MELKQQYPDRLIGVNRLASSPALAVASGITPENAAQLIPCVDYVLVATGIRSDFHNIDATKLVRLLKVAEFSPAPAR